MAGPPKRFAQGMGVAFSVTALILTILGHWTAAEVVLALLACAALLESAFAVCLGCMTFGVLMRAGVMPDEVCERCNDIWADARRREPPERFGARGLSRRRAGRRGCSCRRACPGSPG